MKKILTIIAQLPLIALVGCNSGSNSGTPAPKYLPEGTYTNTAFIASCTNNHNSLIINQNFNALTLSADNVGNILDLTTTPPTALGVLNYAKSPCFSVQNATNSDGVSNLSITFQSCTYNTTTGILSFTETVNGTSNNINITCTGQSTLVPATNGNMAVSKSTLQPKYFDTISKELIQH